MDEVQVKLKLLLDPSSFSKELDALSSKNIKFAASLDATATKSIETAVTSSIEKGFKQAKPTVSANYSTQEELKSPASGTVLSASQYETAVRNGVSTSLHKTGETIISDSVKNALGTTFLTDLQQTIKASIQEANEKEGGGLAKIAAMFAMLPPAVTAAIQKALLNALNKALTNILQVEISKAARPLASMISEALSNKLVAVVSQVKASGGASIPGVGSLLNKLPDDISGQIEKTLLGLIEKIEVGTMSREDLTRILKSAREAGAPVQLKVSDDALREQVQAIKEAEKAIREGIKHSQSQTRQQPRNSRTVASTEDLSRYLSRVRERATPEAPRSPRMLASVGSARMWQPFNEGKNETDAIRAYTPLLKRLQTTIKDIKTQQDPKALYKSIVDAVVKVSDYRGDVATPSIAATKGLEGGAKYDPKNNQLLISEITKAQLDSGSISDESMGNLIRELRRAMQYGFGKLNLNDASKRVTPNQKYDKDVEISATNSVAASFEKVVPNQGFGKDTKEATKRALEVMVEVEKESKKRLRLEKDVYAFQKAQLKQVKSTIKTGAVPVDPAAVYKSIVDAVVKASNYQGEVTAPSVVGSKDIKEGESRYDTKNNRILVSEIAKAQLDRGEISPKTMGNIARELRRALQFEFGKLNLDEAAQRVEPDRKYDKGVEDAAKRALKVVGAVGKEAEKILRLEKDAYGFQKSLVTRLQSTIKTQKVEPNELYKSIVDAVVKVSGYKGEVVTPSVAGSKDLKGGARYDPENNRILISELAKAQLDRGVMTHQTMGDLIHELVHGIQFAFGKLNLDEAAKGVAPKQKYDKDVEDAAARSVDVVGAVGEEAEKMLRLEKEAYALQKAYFKQVEKILNPKGLKAFTTPKRATYARSTGARSERNPDEAPLKYSMEFIDTRMSGLKTLRNTKFNQLLDAITEAAGRAIPALNRLTGESMNPAKVEDLSMKFRALTKGLLHLGAASVLWNATWILDSPLGQTAEAVIALYTEFETLGLRLSASHADVRGVFNSLFTMSQHLGVSFKEAAAGYASFSAAVTGTSLSAKGLDVFEGISAAVSSLGLNTADMQAVFTAVSQMAAKGVVSMEELRGQLAERVPQAMGATRQALQAMIDDGVIDITDINSNLMSASEEVKNSYRATGDDIYRYISKGLLSSTEFLPYFASALGDSVDTSISTFQKRLNKFQNTVAKIYLDIGDIIIAPITDGLKLLTSALTVIMKVQEHINIIGAAMTALGTGTFSIMMFSIAYFMKSLLFANIAIGMLHTHVLTLFATAFKGIVGILLAQNPLLAFLEAVKAKILGIGATIKLIGIPAYLILLSLFSALMVPISELLGQIVGGASKARIKFVDEMAAIGNSYDDVINKIAGKGIVDQREIDKLRDDLSRKFSGTEEELINLQLQYKLNRPAAREEINKLGIDDRYVIESLVLLDISEDLNKERIDEVAELEKNINKIKVAMHALEKEDKAFSLELKERLANQSTTSRQAEAEELQHKIDHNKKVIALARQSLTDLRSIDTNILSPEAYKQHYENVTEVEEDLYEARTDLAELTVDAREKQLEQELSAFEKGYTLINQSVIAIETKRALAIREIMTKGAVDIAAFEKHRIQLMEDRVRSEIQVEDAKYHRLRELKEQAIEGSDEEKAITTELFESAQKRLDLIKQLIEVERERQDELQRQVDIQAELLQGKVDELNTESELLSLASELVSLRQELASAGNDVEQQRLALTQAYIDAESAHISYALEAAELLRTAEAGRRAEVAARLGLEESVNPIELLRQQQAQQQKLTELKREQIALTQAAEKAQLAADRETLKLSIEQEKYAIRAAEIENEIAKLKAQQNLSAAMAMKNAALLASDTKAAAQSELQIVQARRELELLNNNLIRERLDNLRESEQVQTDILDAREEALDLSQEQQLVELSMEEIAADRQRQLDAERSLIDASVRARELEREEAYMVLDAMQQQSGAAVELIKLRDTLADLTAKHAEELAYVQELELANAATTEEQALLLEAQNSLKETGLSLLETELAIEKALAEEMRRSDDLRISSIQAMLELGGEEAQAAGELLALREQLVQLEEDREAKLQVVAELENALGDSGAEQAALLAAQNDLRDVSVSLLETEISIERALADEVGRRREQSLERQTRQMERQVEILEQQQSITAATTELQSALTDLAIARLEGERTDINRAEQLGGMSGAEADVGRANIDLDILRLEEQQMDAQQEADRKRLEIEQQIEMLRLRASKAEAEVTAARARQVEAEALTTLSRAEISGDEGAIAAARSGVDAAADGVTAAEEHIGIIDEQIELAQEIQEIQTETIEAQQKADEQRLENRREELRLTREIADAALQRERQEQREQRSSGGRVSGGGVSAGSQYTVGEQGIEIFKGADGSTRLLGLGGQHEFIPRVPGTIIPNAKLEQTLAANVMRADGDLISAIRNGFGTSGNAFAQLAAILTNRTQKPVTVNNYGNSKPSIDWNNARLARL